MPKVSVIIPSYNHEKYISKAIQSVLDQSYQDFEIVIVDDGSVDESVGEIKKYKDSRIRLFCFEKNQGACVAINKGLAEANGEYIAILNSDDMFLPDKLKIQTDFLEKRPEIGAVFSYAHIIDEEGNDFKDSNHFYYNIFEQANRTRYEWLNYFFYKGNCLCHPSILIRKKCYETIGYYDERYAQLPDFDFWIRLCLKYKIHIIPEELIKFRIRADEQNASGNRPETKKRISLEYIQVLKNFFKIPKEDFVKVFPDISTKEEKIEEALIPWYLANFALEVNSIYYKYFGIDILYNLLANSHLASKIEKKYGFRYINLINLTSKYVIFNDINRSNEQEGGVEENLVLQVFWSKNGYSEQDSELVNVKSFGDFYNYNFTLPLGISHLRIDPVNKSLLYFEIKEIKLLKKINNENPIELCSYSSHNKFSGLKISKGISILAEQENLCCFSYEEDSQMILDEIPKVDEGQSLLLQIAMYVDKKVPVNIVRNIESEYKHKVLSLNQKMAKNNEKICELEKNYIINIEKLKDLTAELDQQESKNKSEIMNYKQKLSNLLDKLTQQEEQLKKEYLVIQNLKEELRLKEKTLKDIYSSMSWRITKLFRWIREKMFYGGRDDSL